MGILRKPLDRAGDTLHIPLEYAAGMPKLELTGLRTLRVEQHRGLAAYGPDEVVIRSAGANIAVRGNGLTLEMMSLRELSLRGEIFAIELVH